MAQQNTSSDEDAWDMSETSELASHPELEREWNSRQAHFHTLGYRDGIEAGKKSSAQEGFEAGFREAIKAGYECGQARGWSTAFIALPESVKNALLDDSAQSRLASSHEKLSSISSDHALHLFHGSTTQRETSSFITDTGSTDIVFSINEVKELYIKIQLTPLSAGTSL